MQTKRKIMVRHNDGHVVLRVPSGMFDYSIYDTNNKLIITNRSTRTIGLEEIDATDEFVSDITCHSDTLEKALTVRTITIRHHAGTVLTQVPLGEVDFWCYKFGARIAEGYIPNGTTDIDIDANESFWGLSIILCKLR